jgi:hypothetical protein
MATFSITLRANRPIALQALSEALTDFDVALTIGPTDQITARPMRRGWRMQRLTAQLRLWVVPDNNIDPSSDLTGSTNTTIMISHIPRSWPWQRMDSNRYQDLVDFVDIALFIRGLLLETVQIDDLPTSMIGATKRSCFVDSAGPDPKPAQQSDE